MKTRKKSSEDVRKRTFNQLTKRANDLARIKWPMNALECCDYACFLWLICLWHGIELNFVTICNLIQLLFIINFLCYHRQSTCCCQFAVRISSTINFSAVKFKREFHFTNISNPHTMTALFASFCAHVLFGRQNKELGVGGLHLLHSDFRLCIRCCKKGDFDVVVVVAVFVITVVVRSFEYLRLSSLDSPPKMSYE